MELTTKTNSFSSFRAKGMRARSAPHDSRANNIKLIIESLSPIKPQTKQTMMCGSSGFQFEGKTHRPLLMMFQVSQQATPHPPKLYRDEGLY